MSDKHTQGRLVVDAYGTIRKQVGGQAIAGWYYEDEFSISEMNARRFVACWNACLSVPTDMLRDDFLRDSRTEVAELVGQLAAARALLADLARDLSGADSLRIRAFLKGNKLLGCPVSCQLCHVDILETHLGDHMSMVHGDKKDGM